MEKQEKKSWFNVLMSYASESKKDLVISVILSIVSILSGMVPYFSIYKIIEKYTESSVSSKDIIFWGLIGLIGYVVKVVLFGLSTGISHTAAFTILEKLRLRVVDRFLHAPLGKVTSHSIGEIKGIIVDKIDNIEPPIAHFVPEGSGYITNNKFYLVMHYRLEDCIGIVSYFATIDSVYGTYLQNKWSKLR